jgi:hypothetical protein
MVKIRKRAYIKGQVAGSGVPDSVQDSKGTAEVDQKGQNRLSGEPDIGATNNPQCDQETAGNTTATAPACHPGRRPNGTFAPGRPSYPVKRLSIRQQRRLQARALERLIGDMSARAERGLPIDPDAYVRLCHLQMRLIQEL